MPGRPRFAPCFSALTWVDDVILSAGVADFATPKSKDPFVSENPSSSFVIPTDERSEERSDLLLASHGISGRRNPS
jgi:hypothetical protein